MRSETRRNFEARNHDLCRRCREEKGTSLREEKGEEKEGKRDITDIDAEGGEE